MSLQWPQLRVGQPLCCRSLTVFPLFADGSPFVEYQLADEAIAGATVAVQEVTESGSVPELLVENSGDTQGERIPASK